VIQAETQAVLNTLREHDFQNVFKMTEGLRTVHRCTEGAYFDYFDGESDQLTLS
jgi:hypothetical protein